MSTQNKINPNDCNDYITIEEQQRDELYDIMKAYDICTEGELGVAIHFGGYNLRTMEEVLFYKTALRSLDQLKEELEIEEEEN